MDLKRFHYYHKDNLFPYYLNVFIIVRPLLQIYAVFFKKMAIHKRAL